MLDSPSGSTIRCIYSIVVTDRPKFIALGNSRENFPDSVNNGIAFNTMVSTIEKTRMFTIEKNKDVYNRKDSSAILKTMISTTKQILFKQ